MFRKIWHRISDRIIDDLFTLEERRLIAARAERLELRTQLQRERIEKRKQAEARKAAAKKAEKQFAIENWRDIAFVRFPITVGSTSYHYHALLEQRVDGLSRKVTWIGLRSPEGGPRNEAGVSAQALQDTCKSGVTWQKYVAAWLSFHVDEDYLRDAKHVTVVVPEKV